MSMWSQWSGLRIGHANRGDQESGLSGQDSGLVMQTGGPREWSQWSGLRIGHANRGGDQESGISGQDSGLVMQTGGTKRSTGQYSICDSSTGDTWRLVADDIRHIKFLNP